MKKIIALVAGLAMSMTAVFAEHTLGLGLNIPVNSLTIDSEDVFEIGFGVDLSYLFIHDSGITAKADAGFKSLSADSDIPYLEGNGVSFGFDLGAGYTFINEEKFSLSALAMFGVTIGGVNADFTDSFETEEIKAETTLTIETFDIGADVIGKYKFTDHLGAFVNLGLRYAINMKTECEIEYEGGDTFKVDDIKTSGIRFLPTLGVSWTF